MGIQRAKDVLNLAEWRKKTTDIHLYLSALLTNKTCFSLQVGKTKLLGSQLTLSRQTFLG